VIAALIVLALVGSVVVGFAIGYLAAEAGQRVYLKVLKKEYGL
jgi:NADH:ubiquinone oxidoreductase subunit 5 (subunit L)/multisubunit Na+/H+ antiporter MnhA subunit